MQTPSAILDSMVRSVCLKVVLHVLFKLELREQDNEKISTITEKINKLWIQSKGKGTPVESDKDDLRKALDQVIPPMKKSDPSEEPLNLIIPAYESLWRVVLSSFLQVTFV